MYYLTYRPQTISEIDNSVPRETIKNILSGKSLPHAYLFVGQKGTGKTSLARIFAKSVNCLNTVFHKKGASIEPCNTCANCKSIDQSSFPDVIEMDAASNRGINEVKNLIKESSFLPLLGTYRVFIIDEAHMITNDGFNALLKTLEEPPSTVLFILATTNAEKIPKTIASRCILIQFGKAKKHEIVHMLKRITVSEKITMTDEALHLVAEYSDNSFRDAAKLLEELVTMKKVQVEDIHSYLGVRNTLSFFKTLESDSISESLSFINELTKTGGSFKYFIEKLLSDLHEMLLAKTLSKSDVSFHSLSLADISLLMKLLSTAYVNQKYTPVDSIPLEIALIEFYAKKQK